MDTILPLSFLFFVLPEQVTDHSKPVDKRIYKGTFPTCHDFSEASVTSDRVHLLIGFSAGQIQLIDPIKKEYNKLFNEEVRSCAPRHSNSNECFPPSQRLIDKTKVTCIKWSPNSMSTFLVSHASGSLYVYKDDLTCGTTPPHFQIMKPGDGFAVYACKSKAPRNPTSRWAIGDGSLNEFSFSPCGKFLATVSQDGFLRVFDYESTELVGRMRSYFGGLLCLSWSPDGRFIAAGGEDDLLTFWSTSQKRVVARGQGHKSWVSVVTFDPFTTSVTDGEAADNLSDEEGEVISPSIPCDGIAPASHNNRNSFTSGRLRNSLSAGCGTLPVTSYRIGSVGQDTQLCLWELSDDVLKQPVGRSRASILVHSPSGHVPSMSGITSSGNHVVKSSPVSCSVGDVHSASSGTTTATATNNTSTAAPAAAKSPDVVSSKKDHKRNFSLGSRSSDKNSVNKVGHKLSDDPVKLLGQPCCPRLSDTPMLEPLICKKISHERLTSLVFRSDCFVTACQEGFVSTWARPGHGVSFALQSFLTHG